MNFKHLVWGLFWQENKIQSTETSKEDYLSISFILLML